MLTFETALILHIKITKQFGVLFVAGSNALYLTLVHIFGRLNCPMTFEMSLFATLCVLADEIIIAVP